MAIQDRKAREFERRGQEILAAALSLFKSDDWEAVTVDQIAQKAEVGKGTIYKHFASKDEIYAELAIKFQQLILAGYAGIDPKLSVIDRFKSHMKAAWDVHLSSKEMHRVFLYCSRAEFRGHLSPEKLAEMQAMEQQVASPTRLLVLEGMAQGLFPRKPLPMLLFGAQSAFWGAIQIVWSGYLGDIDSGRYLDALTSFVLAGLVHNERPITVPSRSAGKASA